MSPFNSRKLIALSLSFAEKHRVTSEPVFDIIERFAPQLSDVPFDFETPPSLDTLYGSNGDFSTLTCNRRQAAMARLAQSLPAISGSELAAEDLPAATAALATK